MIGIGAMAVVFDWGVVLICCLVFGCFVWLFGGVVALLCVVALVVECCLTIG